MTIRTPRRNVAVLTVLVTLGLFAAACGDSSEKNSSDSTGPTTPSPATTRPPQLGGTLVFGEFAQPIGLDPIVAIGGGQVGGTEMAAIYDTLLRYDTATGKYEPQTAESLAPNADFTEWTLKLKQTIKFTDGTAYDAAAVVFGLNRHRSGLPGAPACAGDRRLSAQQPGNGLVHGAREGHPSRRPVHREDHAQRSRGVVFRTRSRQKRA